MGESTTHQILVTRLAEWVHGNVPHPEHTIIFSDNPNNMHGQGPPSVGGYIPDVYYRDISSGDVIVGEAKTAGDIETQHSRKQFTAFLLYLKQRPSATLVVAAPWHVVRQAKSLVQFLQRETETTTVKTVFLEMLPG